ncbi:MAG: MmgE/PrpD family protein [Rhodobiaceae bacterium]|nr:MmgE/PrpD family protein [Rhodobiaceae bacterium]MCC0041981.1 MmgE/PrpD family protein [Rhodobiaceae bacterium]
MPGKPDQAPAGGNADEVAAFVLSLERADLPDDVRRIACRWLLDLCGTAASGTRTALSRIVRDHAATHFGAGGSPAARLIFDGRTVSPPGAALAAGMTIDAVDAHDGHRLTKGHAGCGTLAAVLAMADAGEDTRQDDFLVRFVLGYEIGTRAGVALHASVPNYHTSGAWIALAAAAIGARALKLDIERARHALGIAEYHGPRSQMMRCIDHPTMLKDGSGWGAMAGVSAAFLAADGFTGAPAITTGTGVRDLWNDLGSVWRIREQYYKPWPVCRWAQPAVAAVLTLRARHKLATADVERIEVATFHESVRLAVRHPRTTEEAQYSTAYPVAAAMARGRLAFEEISEAAFADPEIRRLAAGMEMTETAEFNAAFPARRFASVVLHLADGTRLASPPTEAPGDPETAPGDDDVLAKFHDLADPVLGEARARHVAGLVADLADGASARPLIAELLSPARV